MQKRHEMQMHIKAVSTDAVKCQKDATNVRKILIDALKVSENVLKMPVVNQLKIHAEHHTEAVRAMIDLQV